MAETAEKKDPKVEEAPEKKEGEISPNETGEQAGDGEAQKKLGSLFKILLFAGIPTLLLAGAAVFLFLTETGKHLIGIGHKAEEAKLPDQIIYYNLPEMMVNLVPSGKKSSFLRIVVKFEIPNAEAVKTLDLVKPRIIDAFQMYLRELRMDDIEGSAGLQRLREELLKRTNTVTAPIKIKDVLFETLLIQ